MFGFMPSTKEEYVKKRQRMLAIVGDQCAYCGSVEGLEFDHIDRTTKSFCVSKNWGRSWDVLLPELQKCQLLCGPCHYEKSLREGDLILRNCGTYRAYRRGCRCDKCKLAHAEYQQAYWERRQARNGTPRKRSSTEAEHGTRTKYRAGCRCDECRNAHREAHAEWRKRKRDMA